MNDYRIKGTEYIDALRQFISDESLQDNVLILGLIPYEDVMFLMRNCIAIVNPSRFEGWSSTVEEAKSIGKSVLISNIPVHREQAPSNARYFDPDDAAGLASIMLDVWSAEDVGAAERRSLAQASLRERTLAYGEDYVEIVEQITAAEPARCPRGMRRGVFDERAGFGGHERV